MIDYPPMAQEAPVDDEDPREVVEPVEAEPTEESADEVPAGDDPPMPPVEPPEDSESSSTTP